MIIEPFTTGWWIIDYGFRRPVVWLVVYIVFNILIFGFSGLLGGFLPIRVKLSVGAFCTSVRNAFHSERLTRIVQWRYYEGENLPKEVREEILQKYGPSNKRWPRIHYKKVERNPNYKAHQP